MNIEFDLTKQDVIDCVSYMMLASARGRRQLATTRVVAFVLLTWWLLATPFDWVTSQDITGWRVVLVWGLEIVWAALLAWFIPKWGRTAAVRRVSTMRAHQYGLGHWVLRIGDQGLVHEHAGQRTVVPWAALRSADLTPTGIYVLASNNDAFIAPKHAFSDPGFESAFATALTSQIAAGNAPSGDGT